ncbi:cyanophycin synthetase [Paenibacillus bovis]|uniref:Cyanophycin synthetase n=1 Tax=Paenibacillus bovis TaxID=1616788 RepID=A0A172ZHD2_9BACL|nr:cyanophycin synthetase [Paenibacillus bovis]ANF97046.1 cyanophycin synthetase [Paenibacillus bovis]
MSNLIQINKIRYWSGPNQYNLKPTMWIELDIGELEHRPSNLLPGFNEALLSILPSLDTHTCSRGYAGGFVERLYEGTWIGHIIEHITLEIQHLAGIPVRRGKTITGSTPGIYYVTFDYREKESGRTAFESAVAIVEAILAGQTDIHAEPYISQVSELYFNNKLGPSTEAIYNAAMERRIPVERIGTDSTLRLGTGIRQKSVQATVTSQTSYLAVENSCDKEMTKHLLEAAGLPVPRGTVISTRSELVKAVIQLGFPLVLKPANGRQGQGVMTNLQSVLQLEQAYNFVSREFPEYTEYIVERYFTGQDYRFTVVGGKLVAASLRQPPTVTGDGVSTIRQLIAIENTNPLRGAGHEKPMSEIPLEQARGFLEQASRSLDDVLLEGETLCVMSSANLSTGGSAKDVTDQVHPSYERLAIEAAQAIGLDVAGVDIISPDIRVPLNSQEACILEVNAAPGIRMHHYPAKGTPRDVGAAIVDYLFPSREEAAIPLVAVTGTNGKTTTVRIISHLLRTTGQKVGMTCSDGVWAGDECIDEGDCSGPASARKILSRNDIEAAVLETARGGMMREGLAFRWCDVGVVTNISEDHLGQDGLDTLEDLRKLKRLIPEVVLPGGVCILNADDEGCIAMGDHTDGRIVYFSLHEQNPVIQGTIYAGGEVWYLAEDGTIMYAADGQVERFADSREIPVTVGGLAKHNIANSLAALAAAHAAGLTLDQLRQGIRTFYPSAEQSRGRFNLTHIQDRTLIADYGHNPAGMSAVYETVAAMPKKRLLTIVSAPGDRTDRSIIEMGKIIGQHSDLVILKEDLDLRKREPLETARLLEKGCIDAGISQDRLITVPNEYTASLHAWKISEPGDLILMFYDNYENVEKLLHTLEQSSSSVAVDNSTKVKTSAAPAAASSPEESETIRMASTPLQALTQSVQPAKGHKHG